MPWHVRDSLPPPNLSSLRKGRKKHQHLARRWGEKSEGERGEEGRQRKGGRERKGAFTNTTKLQIWLPRLSPHHCKEMKTHFKLEPFPTPLQPPPHALSPGASAHVYQKLNRTREAQNLLCVCERRERASKRERKGGGRGGGGHSFIKYNPPLFVVKSRRQPLSSSFLVNLSPRRSHGSSELRGLFCLILSDPNACARWPPMGAHSHAHSRTHIRTRGSTRTGSHTPRAAAAAAGTCSDGITSPQPCNSFAVRSPNPHLPGVPP